MIMEFGGSDDDGWRLRDEGRQSSHFSSISVDFSFLSFPSAASFKHKTTRAPATRVSLGGCFKRSPN